MINVLVKKIMLMKLLMLVFIAKALSQPIANFNYLKVGDKAPGFTTTNHNGVKLNLYELLQKGKVVIVFYRGAWCPYCNKHMSRLQDSLNLILNKGATVIAITPENNSSIDKTISKTKTTFNVIFDSAYVVMSKYGTAFKLEDKTFNKYKLFGIDVEESNGNKDHILTVPATFIINTNGKIDYLHFDENYKKRSTVSEIIQHL